MADLLQKTILSLTVACVLFVGNTCVCGRMSMPLETKSCDHPACCEMCRHSSPGQHQSQQTCGHCHSILTMETIQAKQLSPSLDQTVAIVAPIDLSIFHIESVDRQISSVDLRPFIHQATLLGLGCALNS
jgi:hypothetical protein